MIVYAGVIFLVWVFLTVRRRAFPCNPEIPASLIRVGAKFVRITANNVEIYLIPESGLTGREWGFSPRSEGRLFGGRNVDRNQPHPVSRLLRV